ncbi:hypothetical protein [Rufibacter sp. XAAS-G3-1]|uniref:hypothetical protein n=1 Tax=Rufibacter sp. XAAS-G3-1 TaxID=2729134 RepID=UPI0015E6608C|nr:hypothetical protein [Rufibacter sp. XAAS-G3-1]
MNSPEPIGGYFGFEFKRRGLYYPDLLALNSGRNALEYILLAREYKKVYIPYFTCDVMLEPLLKHNISYEFYSVNEKLEIDKLPLLQESEALLYTNYFGLKSLYAESLKQKINRLILDNAQAFFSHPLQQVDTIYSPRKFFGLPDGAYLASEARLGTTFDKDANSVERCSHLLLRLDIGAEGGYAAFQKNDSSLIGQPIQLMSELTTNLLSGIDYEWVRERRNQNFLFLHDKLQVYNEFKWIKSSDVNGPMVYPFYFYDPGIRQKLIDDKIFIATYWSNVFNWAAENSIEYNAATYLLPLPIDQRYNRQDMERIVYKIKELL